ncbi:PadR family transcriptional regulator [Phytomonospora endophytica]|uniref:DNA-binding PadR family transcriptional regulator n=1 Tax=Phytomonospora endophytica TaxID=714109 RepID=A0A841G1Q3_9ACTN|nr:helix-turn-helix transcriptional regulator [Phytomonospora endophytica]MBB6038090.1 DNA-binding PadR family transcriptional regulator [Phytomonospora endophytica]GIG67446.1 hypothetical protein Pen01_37410 [Phytomonospora endophytica]
MSLRIALLGLLVESGAASGYGLTKHFELSAGNVWHAKHSQIYPELRKMEADGAIETVEEGARGKRTYDVTEAGRVELRRWLVEHEPERTIRNEASLRMFLLPLLGPEESVPLLRAEAAMYTTRAKRLDEICSHIGNDVSMYQARMGYHNMRAMEAWATETADAIEQKAAGA